MDEEKIVECDECEIHYSDEDDKMTHYASAEEKAELSKQSRWRSPMVWGAIFGLIVAIITSTGIADKIGIDNVALKVILTALGEALAAAGIINNPTRKDGW